MGEKTSQNRACHTRVPSTTSLYWLQVLIVQFHQNLLGHYKSPIPNLNRMASYCAVCMGVPSTISSWSFLDVLPVSDVATQKSSMHQFAFIHKPPWQLPLVLCHLDFLLLGPLNTPLLSVHL